MQCDTAPCRVHAWGQASRCSPRTHFIRPINPLGTEQDHPESFMDPFLQLSPETAVATTTAGRPELKSPPELLVVRAGQRCGIQTVTLMRRGWAPVGAHSLRVWDVGNGQQLHGVQVVQVLLVAQVEGGAVEVGLHATREAIGVGTVQ
eukprot:1156285-Pelagomonas_calceolata.AAC.2